MQNFTAFTIKKLLTLQADPEVLVVSQDEVHFTQRSTVAARLVKRGSRPKVASYPGRAKVSFSGFVELGADKGRLFIASPERFTWETTIASDQGLSRDAGPRGQAANLDDPGQGALAQEG